MMKNKAGLSIPGISCLVFLMLVPALQAAAQDELTLLRPQRVFDGERMHAGWVVITRGEEIVYVGAEAGANLAEFGTGTDQTGTGTDQTGTGTAQAGTGTNLTGTGTGRILALSGLTLLPGLIEGHSHILLHPYDETAWNDQVLKESEAERVARAVNHVRDSLLAGVTTMRDLGSEGAGYADVGVRDAINKGVIPGPRLLVAGKAIVATGSYGPKGFHENVDIPLGAEVADGYDDLVRVVRSQIGRNIDFVKVYADYRWGPNGTAQPSFTQRELETIVEVTASSGRPVVAHAATAEAMKRAILAGVETIEHGDGATRETYRLMREHNVALCPTLAAGDAISQYAGWNKGEEPEPARVAAKRKSFAAALDAGVTICFGGDVGVYPHGDNVRELEMMVEYGMDPADVLQSATSVNADLFHIDDRVGRIKVGLLADMIAVRGDPSRDISALRDIRLVMKGGEIVRSMDISDDE